MITKDVLDGLKEKFSEIHPLIFQRSIERAKSGGELFDILYAIPKEYPIVWDGKWTHTKDLFQSKNFPKKDDEN